MGVIYSNGYDSSSFLQFIGLDGPHPSSTFFSFPEKNFKEIKGLWVGGFGIPHLIPFLPFIVGFSDLGTILVISPLLFPDTVLYGLLKLM
jgi:hypothetical protein